MKFISNNCSTYLKKDKYPTKSKGYISNIFIYPESRIVKEVTFQGETFTAKEDFPFKDINSTRIPLSPTIFYEVTFIDCFFESLSVFSNMFMICTFSHCKFNNLHLGLSSSIIKSYFINECSFSNIDIDEGINISQSFFDYQNKIFNVRFGSAKDWIRFYDDAYNTIVNAPSDISPDLNYLEDKISYPYEPYIFPTSGDFIAWKVIKVGGMPYDSSDGKYLVQLLIPADAKKSSFVGSKCRADRAYVIGIFNIYGADVHRAEAKCLVDSSVTTIYETGKFVTPDSFDERRSIICSHGIHFFLDRKEAMLYGGFEFSQSQSER